ncbi:polymorphic toxin type 44 domain-containing protein, partial [Klebsiella variicola]
SYYHKFKQHDYFYDVWSNIHYGYVGRSVGFSEAILLKGSTWEQNMTPGAMGDDTMDDITSMKIGFNLFYEHGEFAETLTADNILCVLETTPGAQLPHSRENHWCWNTDNPEKSDESF